jgi:hypothetical protein
MNDWHWDGIRIGIGTDIPGIDLRGWMAEIPFHGKTTGIAYLQDRQRYFELQTTGASDQVNFHVHCRLLSCSVPSDHRTGLAPWRVIYT